MPPIFAPASPLGTAVDIGVASGQAAAMQKYSPTLAHIYDSISNSLASRGGHGGGGGGYIGGVQQLGSTDGGAMFQVQQQANREQRSQDFRSAYDLDPVRRHIEDRHQNKLELQKRQQDFAREQTGMQPGVQQPSIVWTQADQEGIAEATQAISTVTKEYQNNNIPLGTYYQIHNAAQEQLSRLNQKKKAFDQQQDQERFQRESQAAARSAALGSVHTAAGVRGAYTTPDAIPGMPPSRWVTDPKTGKIYDLNEHNRKLAYDAWKVQQDKKVAPETAEKMKHDAELHEQKLEQGVIDKYTKLRQELEKRFDKEDDDQRKVAEKKNAGNDNWHWEPWTMEGRERYIDDQMRARYGYGTLKEAEDYHRAIRNRQRGEAPRPMGSGEATLPANASEREQALAELKETLAPMTQAMPPVRTEVKPPVEMIPSQQRSSVYSNFQGFGSAGS